MRTALTMRYQYPAVPLALSGYWRHTMLFGKGGTL